jgi:hypothetical protein
LLLAPAALDSLGVTVMGARGEDLRARLVTIVKFESAGSLADLRTRLEALPEWDTTRYTEAREQELGMWNPRTNERSRYAELRGFLVGTWEGSSVEITIEGHTPDRRSFTHRATLGYPEPIQRRFHTAGEFDDAQRALTAPIDAALHELITSVGGRVLDEQD